MQVQRVQNTNYNTNFGEKLTFDKKLISRATKEEKAEFVYLKNLFESKGIDGNIKVKNNTKTSVKSIIDDLYSRFDKSNSERIKSRKIEDAFDDSRLI